MRLTFFHPSQERLVRWLESAAPPRVGRHVEACVRCADRLDELTVLDAEPVSLLRGALAPSAGAEKRVLDAVRSELDDREALDVFADLFGAGWDAVRLLVGDNQDGQCG